MTTYEDNDGRISIPEGSKLGHAVLQAISILQAQGLKPGNQFPLSKFVDALASSLKVGDRHLLVVAITPDSEKETLALKLLDERLQREVSRGNEITLTQLAYMISNSIADATDNSGL